jgi:C4-dicarboxylate-specific signal transduction histidine kinase
MEHPEIERYRAIGENGLRFFSTVSASIAHELKNVLAIMHENAGLIEDLNFASQRGRQFDTAKLDQACQQFTKQIKRADDIIKNMSRFAHSFDHLTASVNLDELGELIALLAGRKAAMRKVTLAVAKSNQPAMVASNQFLLQNLLWLCLQQAIGETGEGQTLTITSSPDKIEIAGIDRLAGDSGARLQASCGQLLEQLKARISVAPEHQTISLHLA